VFLVSIAAYDVYNYIHAVEIQGYSVINGQVVDCGVEKEKRMRTSMGRSEWKDVDFCFIKYSYLVQGKQYTGEWRHALDEKFTSDERRKLCRGWEIGEPITVYYNPTNHAKSELLRPSRWPSWWHWFACAIVIYVIWYAVDEIRKERNRRRRVRNGESVFVQMGEGENAIIFEKRKETEWERMRKQRDMKILEEVAKTMQARKEGGGQ
jgi:hypothetical protein